MVMYMLGMPLIWIVIGGAIIFFSVISRREILGKDLEGYGAGSSIFIVATAASLIVPTITYYTGDEIKQTQDLDVIVSCSILLLSILIGVGIVMASMVAAKKNNKYQVEKLEKWAERIRQRQAFLLNLVFLEEENERTRRLKFDLLNIEHSAEVALQLSSYPIMQKTKEELEALDKVILGGKKHVNNDS